jgi:hypothetical protein
MPDIILSSSKTICEDESNPGLTKEADSLTNPNNGATPSLGAEPKQDPLAMVDMQLLVVNVQEEPSEVWSNRPLSNPHIPTPAWKWYCILALLNCQCIFQYPITYAMWAWIGYADQRPAWIVGTFLPLSFLCGVVSGVWPSLIAAKRRQWAFPKP